MSDIEQQEIINEFKSDPDQEKEQQINESDHNCCQNDSDERSSPQNDITLKVETSHSQLIESIIESTSLNVNKSESYQKKEEASIKRENETANSENNNVAQQNEYSEENNSTDYYQQEQKQDYNQQHQQLDENDSLKENQSQMSFSVTGTNNHQSQDSANCNNARFEPEQLRKVFVGSLNYNTSEETFRTYFSQYGDLVDCVIMKEPKTNKSRGFGFVTYTRSCMVDEMMRSRPHKLDGRELDTKRATPREESGKPGAETTTEKLFVGAIKEGLAEEHMKEYFSRYGTILDCVIIRDKETQKSRGFGFVTFDDYDPVDKIVLEKFHTINGQSVAVKKALPKEQTHQLNSLMMNQMNNISSHSNLNNQNNNHGHNFYNGPNSGNNSSNNFGNQRNFLNNLNHNLANFNPNHNNGANNNNSIFNDNDFNGNGFSSFSPAPNFGNPINNNNNNNGNNFQNNRRNNNNNNSNNNTNHRKPNLMSLDGNSGGPIRNHSNQRRNNGPYNNGNRVPFQRKY